MTKDNKIIKDLKERNEKLVNQYRDRDIRCVSLERQLEKLQQENLEPRIQVSAREEVANKYKEVIDKAVEQMESWYFALDYAERDRLQIIVEILKEAE